MAESVDVPALSVRALEVDRGGRRIVDDASFEISRGEIVALVGPNGAGKSTVLRAALGLLPYRGEIAYGSASLATLSPQERARAVAYVPQRSGLNAPLRVADVVASARYAFVPDGTTEAVRRALDAARATELATRRFVELSLGEQRRVLFARALATDAPTLLLDEPTASLDLRHARELGDLARSLASSGKSILVVLHDLNEAGRMADRIVVLDRGRVIACGCPDDALSAKTLAEVYAVVPRPLTETGYDRLRAEPR